MPSVDWNFSQKIDPQQFLQLIEGLTNLWYDFYYTNTSLSPRPHYVYVRSYVVVSTPQAEPSPLLSPQHTPPRLHLPDLTALRSRDLRIFPSRRVPNNLTQLCDSTATFFKTL